MKSFIYGVKKGLAIFGDSISMVVNTLILLIAYIFGIGITSLLARICGKKFFDNKISDDQKTYWSDINIKKNDIEAYYHQF